MRGGADVAPGNPGDDGSLARRRVEAHQLQVIGIEVQAEQQRLSVRSDPYRERAHGAFVTPEAPNEPTVVGLRIDRIELPRRPVGCERCEERFPAGPEEE